MSFFLRIPLAAALLALALPAGAGAATITVSPGQKIQEAVNAASPGDTIEIRAGVYTENVTVNKKLTLAADAGAILAGAASGTRPALAFTNSDGTTITGLTVLNTVGDAVSLGGGATLIQRAQLITTAKGAGALVADSGPPTSNQAKTVTIDSTILVGPKSISSAYASPTVGGPGVTIAARHVTAIGNVVADASGSQPGLLVTASQPLAVSFADSIVRGARVTAPGAAGATIAADPARNSVADTAADAGELFVRPAGFNYRLRADAAVIDRGQITSGESATDVDGQERTLGPASDYGADEFANRAPSATLTAPATVRQGLPAAFDASGSADPDAAIGGGIVSYTWNFGDGTTEETTVPTVRHTFAERRAYSVTVTVTDRNGATATSSAAAFTVLDGTGPKVTVGQPAAKQRIPRKTKSGKRRKITFFGTAQDDTAMGTVYVTLRPVASRNGVCRWYDGKRRLIAGSCTTPTVLTAKLTGTSWRLAIPASAKLPAGPYRLDAIAADASGMPGALVSTTFRLT